MIVHGVVDNDPKGLTGRGTIFWMDVTVGENTTRYEYSLLDWLEGKFDREAIIKPAKEAAAKIRKELEAKDKAEKKAALEQRQATVSFDPKLVTIADSIIAKSSKIISEYKSGKEKALNALVGMIIGEAKKQQLQVDAFTISTLLKQKL